MVPVLSKSSFPECFIKFLFKTMGLAKKQVFEFWSWMMLKFHCDTLQHRPLTTSMSFIKHLHQWQVGSWGNNIARQSMGQGSRPRLNIDFNLSLLLL